jgi:two-component system response regulator MprA
VLRRGPVGGASGGLVGDDAPAVRSALKRALEFEHYTVLLADNGEDALDRLRTECVDAIVLDVAMPRLNGLETARRLRSNGDRTPILILTARDAVDDRVEGLDAGADDYLPKPFALRELYARLRALLRRVETPTEELQLANLRLDPLTRDVYRGERRIELSRTEHTLLELFMRNPRQVLTRSMIYEQVWDYDLGPSSSVLGVYMGYLRRKTEAGGEPRLLHTIRGVGYILRESG